ncbi:uncharacterized protein EKO05_0003206 [Ascochyta rabiei]|uniref:uncharacterized protein n=1 Tax=Didymella rabiei TaxID=5454 RepID=UPI0021F9838F|nr:uncharacterized protein EKO05_0003206 [Ascochyta rabiei]UPX12665.1 hypothetical protein EKO05_0003206 [Ascochyta rabiei]
MPSYTTTVPLKPAHNVGTPSPSPPPLRALSAERGSSWWRSPRQAPCRRRRPSCATWTRWSALQQGRRRRPRRMRVQTKAHRIELGARARAAAAALPRRNSIISKSPDTIMSSSKSKFKRGMDEADSQSSDAPHAAERLRRPRSPPRLLPPPLSTYT